MPEHRIPKHDPGSHWDAVYTSRDYSLLSWHQVYPLESLELIEVSGISADSPVIDVGGGSSLLADCLLHQGYGNISVLDCSSEALQLARTRLGSMAEEIKWIVADIRHFRPEKKYMLWHDRAVFHFMVAQDDRKKYIETLDASLDENGHIVIGTFALGGPPRCSGLDVMRYDETLVSEVFAPAFMVVSTMFARHRTSTGERQDFMFFYLRRSHA